MNYFVTFVQLGVEKPQINCNLKHQYYGTIVNCMNKFCGGVTIDH
jgi:hypothetical protein